MTANEYRAALARFGLTQTGAARLFRADERTSRRWASGDRAVPPTVEILLELLLQGTLRVRDPDEGCGSRSLSRRGEHAVHPPARATNQCVFEELRQRPRVRSSPRAFVQ